MTVWNLVLHSGSNAIGLSLVIERFHLGRAGSPLVAPKCSDINSAIVGTRKERSTVFNQNSPGAGSLITVYIPVSCLSYLGYGSDKILQFLSEKIEFSSPPFLIMHLGYASPARIRSGYGYNARIKSSGMFP